MNLKLILALFLFTGLISACEKSKRISSEPMETVDFVDVNRYAGKWYEIARFPFFAQKDCFGTYTEYGLNDNGTVNVLNACRKNSLDGELTIVQGQARIIDEQTNAKLKVKLDQFPGNIIEGDYWVIFLDENYRYAVVSEPQGRYLWILNREPFMDEMIYQSILDFLKKDGFLIEYLIKTEQE